MSHLRELLGGVEKLGSLPVVTSGDVSGWGPRLKKEPLYPCIIEDDVPSSVLSAQPSFCWALAH